MTVGEMADALFSKMGILPANATATRTTDVFRILNLAKDKFVEQNKWSFLESSENQLWTTSQRIYGMGANVSHVVSLEQADGTPLEPTERDTFDELYRGASDTASAPTRYAEQGTDGDGLIQVTVWPDPQSNTTGTRRFSVRVPDILNAASTGTFAHIPENHHHAILAIAEAEWARYEDAQEIQVIDENADQTSAQLAGAHTSPLTHDGTDQ